MKNRWLLTLMALGASTTAFADDIRLGDPAYGGNGCPSGTASATISPDGKELSILFDQYSAEAGGTTGKRLDRKSCNVAIPVHVPQGYAISIIGVDYRGFTDIPQGGRAQFNVEYFFAGSRGPKSTRDFNSSNDGEFLIRNNLGVESLVWSACGADVNLRTNSSMMVQTNFRNEQAVATVDSVDVNAEIIYHLQWKRCY